MVALGLGSGHGLRSGRRSTKTARAWGVEDATVMGWLRAAHAKTGALEIAQIGDSNQQFNGTGWDFGLPLAAQDAGFEFFASPFAKVVSSGSLGWTPGGIVSSNPFGDSGAPSELTALYPGIRADGVERFFQHGYDYAASAGGSESAYRRFNADLFWKNGEPMKLRFHHGANTGYGTYKNYLAYDDGGFEEIDSANRGNIATAGAAALAYSERDVAENAVAAGRPYRYAVMRGADRPTYPLYLIAGRLSRAGMTYGLASSTLWAAGGQSLWDLVENLSTYETAGGLTALLARWKADQIAQGIVSPKLLFVWQMGINDRAETGTSIDGLNANNTKAGYKANLTYCMDYFDDAAVDAGLTVGHLLVGPHVRPDNSYVGDDLAGDEEQLILLRDADDEIARSRVRTMSVRDDAYIDGATKDGLGEYDAGGTAHEVTAGYRQDWRRRWNALGFPEVTAGPVLTPTVEENVLGTQVTIQVATDKWAEVSLIILAAASPAPSVAAVKAGTGALGSGLATDRARYHDAAHLTVTGLSGVTDYVAYAVGTDFRGNDSAAVATIPFTTSIAYFQPSDDANHYATYDPADIVASGGNITSWPEKYGTTALNLAVANGTPTVATIDGGQVADFDGSSRLRTTGASMPLPITVMGLFRWDTGSPANGRVISTSQATTADAANFSAWLRNGSGNNFGAYRGNWRAQKAVTADTFVMFQVTMLADGTVKTRINGGAETSDSGASAYAGTLTYLALGARADIGTVVADTETLNGAVGPVIVIKRDVSADTTERQKLEGWLAHQFDTPANYLPGGHPWLSSPPTL